MGLVDYNSDSGSDDEQTSVSVPSPAPTPAPAPTKTKKPPTQKLVDSAMGRILIHLPSDTTQDDNADVDADADGPPAKRARIGAARGGSRFSGFASFLPPPKNTGAASKAKPSSTVSSEDAAKKAPKPGVHLKTSGEAAFQRSNNDDASDDSKPGKLSLPAPKQPSIPRDQKAAEDVELVGNPLMFMPLSVTRRPGQKKKGKTATKTTTVTKEPKAQEAQKAQRDPKEDPKTDPKPDPNQEPKPTTEKPPKKKPVSLFSLPAEDQPPQPQLHEEEDTTTTGYQPLFHSYTGYSAPQTEQQTALPPPPSSAPTTVHSLADDLQLSARERRELFGRGNHHAAAAPTIAATFDMDAEYRHNSEVLRQQQADGQQQTPGGPSHNPVRAIQPGKHSLRQLVSAAHSQRDALEEAFAQNRAAQRDAGARYGFR